jgi:sec-independent protein translocase protein TatA
MCANWRYAWDPHPEAAAMFRNPYSDGLIVILILLLFFGPKRLPTLGRSLGQGLREFKQSISGESSDDDEDRPALTQAPGAPAVSDPAAQAAAAPAAPPTAEPTPAGTPADRAG